MKIVAMPNASGDADFFRPKDETADYFLIEVLEYEPGKQTKYGPKDWIHANVHSNKDGKWEDRGKMIISSSALVRNLKDVVNSAVIVSLGQVPTDKGNPAWVFNRVSPKQEEEGIAYAQSLGNDDAPDADEAPDPFDGSEEPPPF